ncbi:MAG: tetratricopeptide repeat protein, partial [Flavobacteriales bacterium]
ADKDLQNEAQLVIGRCQLAAGEYAKARAAFAVVAKRTNSEMTAESKYSIAYIAFMEGDYKESQRLSMEVQNQVPAYDYWIAKSFILLGDNYLAQRDTFQARETYKSIVDNFDKGPDDPDD